MENIAMCSWILELSVSFTMCVSLSHTLTLLLYLYDVECYDKGAEKSRSSGSDPRRDLTATVAKKTKRNGFFNEASGISNPVCFTAPVLTSHSRCSLTTQRVTSLQKKKHNNAIHLGRGEARGASGKKSHCYSILDRQFASLCHSSCPSLDCTASRVNSLS